MIINGTNFIPGYINHEGEVVEGGNEHHSTVVQHRHQTRQRHLSSGGDEDIASSYFAAQYGTQQKKVTKQSSKQTSGSNSRRNSVANSSNANVSQVMANAAAQIAAKKQKEREEASKREANHKRQLQQREMTPDNLKIVEKKLIEFQQQQTSQDQQEVCNGHEELPIEQMEVSQYQQHNQQQIQINQEQQQFCQQQTVMTHEGQSYEQHVTNQQQMQQTFQYQNQVHQQQQQQTIQQSYQQQQQQTFQQQTQIHQQHQQQTLQQQSHQLSYQQQHEQHQVMNNMNGLTNGNSIPYDTEHLAINGYGSGKSSVPREVRGGSEMTYMALLPDDGSMPHRTNPIGDPITKRSQSVAATPDREVKRKWSISSSTDYLNKTNRGSYMCRNNPIGLAEPSVKRDGYAVGSREGSMYRSTGNVNVSSGTVGSRAASEAKDIPNGYWQGRRASTSDIKGSGIRVGSNLVEPSSKAQPCMPFGNANKSGGYVKRRVNKNQSVQKSSQSSVETQEMNSSSSTAQHITENKLKSKRERNKTISGDSIKTQTSSKTLTQQVGYALSGITTALEQIQVNESKQNVTMPLPRKGRRAQSLPRGQVSNEESSFKVSLPGSARTSRHASVEPDHNRKKLSRHGSVEIFDGAYNLTVPNKLSRHSSTSKLEEIHADHIKIVGQSDEDTETAKSENHNETRVSKPALSTVDVTVTKANVGESRDALAVTSGGHDLTTIQTGAKQSSASSSVQQETSLQHVSSSFKQSSSSQQSTCMQQATSFQQSESYQQSTSVQQSSSVQNSSKFQQQSVVMSGHVEQQSIQVASQSQNSCNDTVVSGNRFNISNGLKRQSHHASQEEVRRSRHVSGTVEQKAVGSALKGLDTALEQIATQQKKEETQYVAKVTSKQTSRRGSISVSTDSNDVTNVMVSLPASKNTSRTTSRRNSVDLTGARKGRRGSLDIYTAEYAVKIGNKKNITNMEQKTTFHMKVDNQNETDLNLCGRCHLPTHKTAKCTEFGDNNCPRCLAWEHWEDSCWAADTPKPICERCNYEGHTQEVHDTDQYAQRRACVDALGWEPFQEWFYDQAFRGWWQVMGCVGVPLYRIYQRKTEWKTEKPDRSKEDEDRHVARDDSVDDMIAQVLSKKY